MNKCFSLTLLAATMLSLQAFAEKVPVSVTMNSTSRTMQLVPFSGGEAVEIGEPTSNKYTFEAEPGRYLLTGYTSTGLRNGTLVVDLREGSNINVCTVTAKATNSGWVLGQDYSVKATVTDGAMNPKEFITGVDKAAQSAVTFLALSGDVYNVSLVPSAARQAEGYLPYTESNPITFNKTISKVIPKGHTLTFVAPKGASVFVGSKIRHFMPFEAAECIATEEGDNTVAYTYVLAENTDYNYRVSMDGKMTTAAKFKMASEDMTITVTEEDMEGDPHFIDRDPTSNNNYNVADIFLNGNETGSIDLTAGDTFQIVNLRNWEIVDGVTNNYFIEPDYHYTVIDENGQPSNDVIEVTAGGLIKAKGEGTAIVLVTYDALNAPGQVGGPTFGAIWPENTGVMVVRVNQRDTQIVRNMLINEGFNTTNADKLAGQFIDAELDVIYYTGANAVYSFTPENVESVAVASPVITENGVTYSGFSSANVSKNMDGVFTVSLPEGRNIVRLSNIEGCKYQVIRAKKLTYEVTNTTNEGQAPAPGDVVTVKFNDVYHPCNKLAGVYNMSAKIQYNVGEDVTVTSKQNQYQFAANDAARTITVTIPEDWDAAQTFAINGGVLVASGYGDPYGGHRDITYTLGKNPNFTAVQHTSHFGTLPQIILYSPATSAESVATFENFVLEPETTWAGDENGEDWYYGLGYQQYFDSGDYSFSNYCMPDFDSWIGYAYTNSTSTEYNDLDDQFNSCVGHGYDGSANYCVAYPDGTMWGETLDIKVKGEPRVVPGFYITNTAWVVKSILEGDGYTDGPFKAGDFYKITIHAMDEEGNVTATRDYCLADYRFEDASERYYVNDWQYVDLSSLGVASAFKFSFTGSRNNDWGITTPTYFCIDNFGDTGTENVRPEGSYTEDPSMSVEDVNAESKAAVIYNMQGIRVNEMTEPGIYVVNGRKILKR